MNNVMVTSWHKNPNADRMIEFIAKFAASLSAKNSENGKTTGGGENDEAAADANASQPPHMFADEEHEAPENLFMTALIEHLIQVGFFLSVCIKSLARI